VSKRRHVPDAERTAIMVDLLREQHPIPMRAMSLSHVVLEEVAPGTGWGARWADVLVLSCWRSKGQTLTGYEVKASKADLKRELADLNKHQALARYCDAWWLVVWDESVLVDGIPDDWGIMITEDSDYGRVLTTKRRAAKRTPEDWTRNFVCSLVRNAFEQSPGVAYVSRVVRDASECGLRDGRRQAERETMRRLEPVARLLYGKDRWSWPKEAQDEERLIEAAVERLSQGVLGTAAPA
jgi:hypothetical protein